MAKGRERQCNVSAIPTILLLTPFGLKCAVDGDTADLVAAYRGGNAFLPLCVGLLNVLVV